MRVRKGSIHELELFKRVSKRLEYENIRTIRALLQKSPFDLLAWPGFGLTSLREIRRELEKRGLALKNDPGSEAIMAAVLEARRSVQRRRPESDQ